MTSKRALPSAFVPVALGLAAAALALDARAACAAAASGPHGVDLLPVLEALMLILVGARFGGALFERMKLPAVLGELLAGIVIGNLGITGWHGLDNVRRIDAVAVLAQLGVMFLLFEVGLQTNVKQMLAVGLSSTVVATLGVIAPMVLGYFCSAWFFPAHNVLTHWFVGATLSATSVGITARVLGDLGKTASVEGRIILGAAVIDDVMGLVVLAVVAGVITAADTGVAFSALSVLIILAKSIGFLVGAVVIGQPLSKGVFRIAEHLHGEGLLLSFALAFCFLMAYIAGKVGLAPIVGAFAAGLVLDPAHYQGLRRRSGDPIVSDLMRPLATFLVPVFFVLMGMSVDLQAFGNVGVLGFAAALTLAAIVGKQACSLGVIGRGVDRLAVGLGMIPRGEVGLIFAGIGATLHIAGERVVDDAVFSAVVIMVAVTTLVTPPLLVWRMGGLVKNKTGAPVAESR